MVCAASTACAASSALRPGDAGGPDAIRGAIRGTSAAEPVFAYTASLPAGNPDPLALLNREGSPRIEDVSLFHAYMQQYRADVLRWAAEPGIALNPNYVLALFAKESAFDPRATSYVPANGVAQMTPIADADLRRIARDDPSWQWVRAEAESWPRHRLVHGEGATKARTDSLVRAGVVHAGNEYFFNPGTESRAAMVWLRMLAEVWRGHGLDREPSNIARAQLNDGSPLTDSQILDVVTVSYNQGYPYVMDLIGRHGRGWKGHLNEEAVDYLERVRAFTVIFQQSASR